MVYNVQQLVDLLVNLDLLNSITQAPNFYDEPKFYNYACGLKPFKNVKDKLTNVGSLGFSLTSKNEALFKALAEVIERYCLYSFQKTLSIKTSIKDKNILSFPLGQNMKASVKNWTYGMELTQNTKVAIPTQLVYIGSLEKGEKEIMESNSTGAAFGFDEKSAILRGIYEIVERDAFMCFYLTKIPPKKIRLSSVKNAEFHSMVKYLHLYNLEVNLFDITTDLEIPSFLSCLIDKSHSNSGPSIVLGIKTSLDRDEAILGSIKEAIQLRPWIRYRHTSIKKSKQVITTLQQRENYWYNKTQPTLLDFILKQRSLPLNHRNFYETSDLNTLLEIFKHKRISVYSVNITNHIFPKDFFVFKTLIPELQPLYLNETKQFIQTKRLQKFSSFHKKDSFSINQIPHPFL